MKLDYEEASEKTQEKAENRSTDRFSQQIFMDAAKSNR